MNDSISSNISGLSALKLDQNEQRFKIKSIGKGRYPRVYSTASFSNLPGQHIVNVVEVHKHHGIAYHIELNDKGEVTNWCQGGLD